MRILITGASGFIGQALCSKLVSEGHQPRAVVRSTDSIPSVAGLDVLVVGEVGAQTDWTLAMAGVDCVIHCAARAHVMNEVETDALSAYRSVNVAGTRRLAEQGSALGLRRLVYLSSIKVNREQTTRGMQLLSSDSPAPEDPYGVSKWEAEQALWAVSKRTGLEVVVIRPPLVYGPGVKGNLLRLLRLVERGVPLPLGAVHNKRSLVGLSNLMDLLLCCAKHPAAAGKTFLASDGHDLSTPQFIRLIAEGMNKPSLLVPVPVALLQAVSTLLGKRDEIARLVSSLQVDTSQTVAELAWTAPVSVEDGVREMALWYSGLQDTVAR